ncbi:MAG TPA: DinB family protein [Actinomycetota bacterium]
MARPTRKDALATLEEGQARLDDLLGRLSEQELIRPATIGGGEWSAKDLIGHIGFWEEVALEVLDSWRRQEVLNLAEAFAPGGADGMNAWNRDRKARWSLQRVQRDGQKTHRALMEQIGHLSDQDWLSVAASAGRRTRLGTRLGSVLGAPRQPFGHAFAHIPDLERYVASVRA